MRHPKTTPMHHPPILPRPWHACVHHKDDAHSLGRTTTHTHATRSDAIAWLHTQHCLHDVPSESNPDLVINRTDIPECLYTPNDIIVLNGRYTISPPLCQNRADQAILPTVMLYHTSSHLHAGHTLIVWKHATPSDWPIAIMIRRYYAQTIQGTAITLTGYTGATITLYRKRMDPDTSPLDDHTGMPTILIRDINTDHIDALHTIIQDTLMDIKAQGNTPHSISQHQRTAWMRSIPTVIDPDLFSIVAPSYTID